MKGSKYMPRIDVSGKTRNVIDPVKGHMKWGRWSAFIEGGFNESPEEAFAEALRRVKGLTANTEDAENITMYGKKFEEEL
jgi:hypothetical protein